MERYGGIQAMEEEPGGYAAEWAAPGGETGLEEPLWQLGLGGGYESYPERPHNPDCIYYLRTGFCGYGNRCRFNHPRHRSVAMGTLRAGGTDYPERVGQPVCQHYMGTGVCKFGTSCKYHHPKHGVGSSAPAMLNYLGYPLRLGEKECSYYIRTGKCKFGVTCKFHHPQPADIQVLEQTTSHGALTPQAAIPTPSVYPSIQFPVQSSHQYGVMSGNWPVARPPMLPGSYAPGGYGPLLLPPGIVPVPGWNPYLGPVSQVAFPNTQPTGGAGPVYGIAQLSPRAAAYTGPYFSVSYSAGPSGDGQKEHSYPEKPGQADCLYYLRTGACKFGAACKYHHPSEWGAHKTNSLLNPMGLPLRPGVPLCSHFTQKGSCKFGPSCKFDHSITTLSYSPSTSSLTGMPVAPYPVGSTYPTLAPSSSSSDLRRELLTAFDKDTFSLQMSSMSSSSDSVGSTFSKGDHVPLSSIHQSGMSSTSSSVGNDASHKGEATASR